MEKIRKLLGKPLVAAILGFVLGIIIGLPILGWGPLAVKWKDASAEQLRTDAQVDYLRMAVESYSRNRDGDSAKMRWQELGVGAEPALSVLQAESPTISKEINDFRGIVGISGSVIPETTPAKGGTPSPTEESPSVKKGLGLNLSILGVVFCLLTLGICGVVAFLFFQRRKGSRNRIQEESLEKGTQKDLGKEKIEYGVEGQERPITQFMTTYMLGDDLYDDSFSIDSPNGEFLGECGVGVSDTIGIGDPKKVGAFEVWLFDKNDIQTVTKVLMSEHAFNNPEIKQRLASKGEPVLLESGKHILLETATLQLEARVVDMNYGQGALPQNSFFERLTLELEIWPKKSDMG